MRQYCRYCSNMVCGNGNYCSVHGRTFSDAYIKSANTCKDFELNEIDALGLTETYKPRKEKREDGVQLQIFGR